MSMLDISTCDQRFIARRSLINPDFCDYMLKIQNKEQNRKVLLTTKTLNIRETISSMHYRESLYKMLFPEKERMLNFTQTGHNHVNNYIPDMPQWNVTARKSPLISSPIEALDMPNIATNLYADPIDWSSEGIFATAFENEIYTTNEHFTESSHTNTLSAVENCVKWNRSGKRFACAMKGGKISIWDYVHLKEIGQNKCIGKDCTITRIEWDSHDRVISGCSSGDILCWSNDLKICMCYLQLNEGPIIYLKLNHNENYLAISTLHGHINITEWPFTTKYAHNCSLINYKTPTKAIAWHPTKNWLAIGGAGDVGTLSIVNINVGEAMYFENLGVIYNKDAIAWNPISNELVVSVWKENEETKEIQSTIIVLSSLSRIVDSIETNNKCRVPYLMWGENGNLLATVGVDETLNVWKFFGDDADDLCKKKNTTKNDYEYDFKHIITSIR